MEGPRHHRGNFFKRRPCARRSLLREVEPILEDKQILPESIMHLGGDALGDGVVGRPPSIAPKFVTWLQGEVPGRTVLMNIACDVNSGSGERP